MVGAGASGEDIAKELAASRCTKGDDERQVYVVVRSPLKRPISNLDNIHEAVGNIKVGYNNKYGFLYRKKES